MECSQQVHEFSRMNHTGSVWGDRNSILGRGNSMCKGGVAMQSVSGECVQLLYSSSTRAGSEIMTGGHTRLSVAIL